MASTAMALEVVTIPVADVDRAKGFYEGLGWRLDADLVINGNRTVQFTPPRSRCSIHFGEGLTAAAPGSADRLILAVEDIDAARDERGALLLHDRVVQRPRRQRLGAAGDHHPAAGTGMG